MASTVALHSRLSPSYHRLDSRAVSPSTVVGINFRKLTYVDQSLRCLIALDRVKSVSLEQLEDYFSALFSSHKLFAVKIIGKTDYNIVYEICFGNQKFAVKRTGASSRLCALRELNIGSCLPPHPNILSSYFNLRRTGRIHYTVMERAPGTTLDDVSLQRQFCLHPSKNQRGVLNQYKRLVTLTRSLLSALLHIHHHGVVHRDIKPKNIHVDLKHGFKVKILDWGISRSLLSKDGFMERRSDLFEQVTAGAGGGSGVLAFEESKEESDLSPAEPKVRRLSKKGTPQYVAPEIILTDECSYAVDIWSLGVTLYTLATGKYPFDPEEQRPCDYYREITMTSIKFPSFLPAEYADLLMKMLKKDPNERPTAYELLHHTALCNKLFSIDDLCHRVSSLSLGNKSCYIREKEHSMLRSPRSFRSDSTDSTNSSSSSCF